MSQRIYSTERDRTASQPFTSAGHASQYRCPQCECKSSSLLGWRKRRVRGLPQFICPSCNDQRNQRHAS